MAQTTQIVPKFSFPYVETVVNDYTVQNDNEATNGVDPSIRMAYAVVAGKGIDNVWVKKKSRKNAVKTFGESNFNKFGQPLMQALEVLSHDNSKCWIMRVMPENATYANAVTSVYYKADTADDVKDAHLRKFRIKHTAKTFEGIVKHSDLVAKSLEFDGEPVKENGVEVYKDAEGFRQLPFSVVRYSGHGKCGELFSMRISKPYTYEKEYGISMYNFEILSSESGLTKDANYIGSLVSSKKYGTETTTLINDILDETEAGVAPVFVNVNEQTVETLYDAYIEFCKQLHKDLETEYEEKVAEYAIPEDQMNGTVAATEENIPKIKTLEEIEVLLDRTADAALPDLDCFDPIYGVEVGTSGEKIPAIAFQKMMTDDVDVTAEGYNALDYTETDNLVEFSSAKGLVLEHGTDGFFDNPRTTIVKGKNVKWTLEDEVTDCYKKAFSGAYDKRILSSRRIDLSVFFDANYPFEVKEMLADLCLVRNTCRCHLDCNIIESLSTASLEMLINKYRVFKSNLISKDIHNYQVRESSTNKKCRVTISYFLAPAYVDHITSYGFQIPFVKEYCQLTGHIKDSLLPVIEEYDTDLKELLYDNRFNYFEALSETELQRAVQNTCQAATSDLLEENNVRILYELKNGVERDVQGELYNFSDEATRQSFIEYEKAKYAPWIGTILESFNIRFATTAYEFNKSILHAYIEIVFRGLNKKAIVEIDINKRQYTANVNSED